MESYINVIGNGKKTVKVFAEPTGVINKDTLRAAFLLKSDAVIGLLRNNIALRCDSSVFYLQSGWNGANFELIWEEANQSPPATPIEQDVGAKRKRVKDIFTEEEKVSYWNLYKHFLFYTKLNENTKAAASLLDKHHLVLCLHEVPKLHELRVQLIQLSTELDEFLQEYNGDESFKEVYSSRLQENIVEKEKELKFQASKIVMEFFNFKNESFLLKFEYYNWQHDVCVMRSVKPLHNVAIETELCERGTNYIILGFRPPEYSSCIIDGIVSGSMNGHYLCGSPGAFPGMSGGPVLEKFSSGTGRLLGICSGSQDSRRIGINSSFSEALNALSAAQTNLPYVLITPTLQFRFGHSKQKTKSYEILKALEEMHLSRPSSVLLMTKDNKDKTTQI